MIPIDTILSDGFITLRLATVEDTPALVEAVQESVEQIMPWMDWCTPDCGEEIARRWLATLPEAWEAGTQFGLVITDAQTGKLLGGTGINHINRYYRLANLGYWVRTSATGRGVATRAARLVGEFGIKQLGLLRTEIVVAVGNKPSLRVAKKTGAKREGVLRNRLTVREKVLDAVMHSLIPQNFVYSIVGWFIITHRHRLNSIGIYMKVLLTGFEPFDKNLVKDPRDPLGPAIDCARGEL